MNKEDSREMTHNWESCHIFAKRELPYLHKMQHQETENGKVNLAKNAKKSLRST